jgi:transcriptional regulator with XRE-family HTH domain
MSHKPPLTPDVINVIRKSLGMSDDTLASACGIARSTLRTKIRNVDLFTLGELKRIGPALGADYTTWLEPVAA